MTITAKDIKAFRQDAVQGTKKFIRLKEKQVKGCFYQATKEGLVTCILRYDFEGSNKVYAVAEIGSSLGQVALGTALSMAKKKAREIKAGGDPQADYKAEKQQKKLAEKAHKDPKHKDDIYVAERAEAYYRYNNSLPATKKLIRESLDEIVLAFGHKRIKDVTKQDVIDLLLKLETRGKEGKFSVAARTRRNGSAMWDWGMDVGGFEAPNYFAGLKSLKKRHKSELKARKLYPADIKEIAETHYAEFSRYYQRCILLQAYTAVRSGNVTSMAPMVVGGEHFPIDWSEFDLTEGVWHLKKERMKGRKREHIIDVPQQLLTHLKLWHAEDGYPESGLVTKKANSPYGMLDPRALMNAYSRRNLTVSPHDWRACIGTELADMEGCSKELSDLILAHYKTDRYINTTKRAERKKWLQVWADKLDTLGFDKILMDARKASLDLQVISQ